MISLFVYRLILLLFSPILLLALLIRSMSQPAYRYRLSERFGFISKKLQPHSVIFHAASVGEVNAIKTVVSLFLQNNPNERVTLTTFTPTGSAQARKVFQQQIASGQLQHCYFPLDIWPATKLFLTRLKPKAMVVMETEIWPNILAQASYNNIPLILINARLSPSSLPKYQKLTPLITPAINRFNAILCQSQDNLANFIALGANRERCNNVGNIKYDIQITPTIENKLSELKRQLIQPRKLLLLASSHDGDETIVLTMLKQLQAQMPNLLLAIAPRHPERFEAVADLITQQNLTVARRSQQQTIDNNTQVWLLDTLGELSAAFGLADTVIMGGSFSQIGGHNPLEPALFSKPVICGADMHNFQQITDLMLANDALIQLASNNSQAQLFTETTRLLTHPELAQQIGNAAHNLLLANQGASAQCVSTIEQLIQGSNRQ